MKTLMMVAAAMTIAGGAYASECGDSPTTEDCALVYKVKMNLKTTAAKALGGSSSVCGDSTSPLCYRKKGSMRLQGYAYACDCTCEDFIDGLSWYVWDKKNKALVIDDDVPFEILNRFDKSGKKVEGMWVYGGVAGSGMGTYSRGVVKSISGNVAGAVVPPYCDDNEDLCDETAIAYDCDDTDGLEANYNDTVVYGTWSIRYSRSQSKKYAKGDLYMPEDVEPKGIDEYADWTGMFFGDTELIPEPVPCTSIVSSNGNVTAYLANGMIGVVATNNLSTDASSNATNILFNN